MSNPGPHTSDRGRATRDGLQLIFSLLTVIPVGRLAPITPASARVAMLAVPLARLVMGLLAAAVIIATAALGLPAPVMGLLAVAAVALGNRAMHIDGLSDTVDGFGGGWNRDRALEVMHLGNAGPMGVAAVVVTIGLQATAWSALIGRSAHPWQAAVVVAALITSSGVAATLLAARGVPAAPRSGLAAEVSSVVPRGLVGLWWLLSAALMQAAAWLADLPWYAAGASSVVALVGVGWLLRRALAVFGGVTGDIMGAAIEIQLSLASVAILIGGREYV